jgi:uncharacterized protein (TIGR01777 family)
MAPGGHARDVSGARHVAVTGASGFLGSALVRSLRAAGHEVRTVGRSAASDVRWDPTHGAIDAPSLEGSEAIVHLAGANIAQRWTTEHRREILESRVRGTRLIAEACASLQRPPEVLLCASAIGFYGSRGDEWLDESSAAGDDFLAQVVGAWESAAEPARRAGIRVVHLRTGIVLHPEGGALRKMLPPFSLGVGGRLGTGRQWMSWVSREDTIAAIRHAMQSPALHGPVNVVAPEPVTNATFTSTLARVLRRPAMVPVPALALRAVYGAMARGTILASQRVRARALAASGFVFRHRTLAAALRAELGRD